MSVSRISRFVWTVDRLNTLVNSGAPVVSIRSTDLQNAFYISGQAARQMILDWYEDGWLDRQFTGTETQPRYDYWLTDAGIAFVESLTPVEYWRHVAMVNDDVTERKSNRDGERPAGRSVLKQGKLI